LHRRLDRDRNSGSSLGIRGCSSPGEPALARLLERCDVCFRATTVRDDAHRERIASRRQCELEHRPPPGAT